MLYLQWVHERVEYNFSDRFHLLLESPHWRFRCGTRTPLSSERSSRGGARPGWSPGPRGRVSPSRWAGGGWTRTWTGGKHRRGQQKCPSSRQKWQWLWNLWFPKKGKDIKFNRLVPPKPKGKPQIISKVISKPLNKKNPAVSEDEPDNEFVQDFDIDNMDYLEI